MIQFAYPLLALLFFLPLAIMWLFPKAKKTFGDALTVPFIDYLMEIQKNTGKISTRFTTRLITKFRYILLWLTWIFCVIALCRPQWAGEPLRVENKGRDILLVVDISNSMREADLKYQDKYFDRISVVKSVVGSFIDERKQDRLGLVLFGSKAYLQAPLTYDKQSLKEILEAVEPGMAGNSTAIGDAIGVGLKNLIANGETPDNKAIILLTDGENNDGSLSLPLAIKLAKDEKIKVYTIGVDSGERAFFGGFFNLPVNSGLDEESLQKLADETKGRYFRATDVDSLLKIYDEINLLEPKTKQGRFIQEVRDLFYYPATVALILFALLILLTRKVW